MTDITMAPAPSSIRVGEVFSRAFALLFGDFTKFYLVAAVFLSPYLLLSLFGTGSVGTRGASGAAVVGGLLGILWAGLSILGQAAMLYGAIQKMRGQEFSIDGSVRRGLARFFPLLGMMICLGIGVSVGFLLLIIPGVILGIMWYVAAPVCVAERLGPIASLSRSAYLTKGNRWRVFGIAVLVGIVTSIAQALIQLALIAVGGATVGAIGVFLWMSLVQAFNSIVVAVLYHDLRVVREGVDIEQIAAVFD